MSKKTENLNTSMGRVDGGDISGKSQTDGSVSLTELEQFVDGMGVDESKCLVGDHGVGFTFGFADAVAQLTAFIQQKKQNDKTRDQRRKFNVLVLFLQSMMIFNAMNMVAMSQDVDAPHWLYITYQPVAFATVLMALLLGKQNEGE